MVGHRCGRVCREVLEAVGRRPRAPRVFEPASWRRKGTRAPRRREHVRQVRLLHDPRGEDSRGLRQSLGARSRYDRARGAHRSRPRHPPAPPDTTGARRRRDDRGVAGEAIRRARGVALHRSAPPRVHEREVRGSHARRRHSRSHQSIERQRAGSRSARQQGRFYRLREARVSPCQSRR